MFSWWWLTDKDLNWFDNSEAKWLCANLHVRPKQGKLLWFYYTIHIFSYLLGFFVPFALACNEHTLPGVKKQIVMAISKNFSSWKGNPRHIFILNYFWQFCVFYIFVIVFTVMHLLLGWTSRYIFLRPTCYTCTLERFYACLWHLNLSRIWYLVYNKFLVPSNNKFTANVKVVFNVTYIIYMNHTKL